MSNIPVSSPLLLPAAGLETLFCQRRRRGAEAVRVPTAEISPRSRRGWARSRAISGSASPPPWLAAMPHPTSTTPPARQEAGAELASGGSSEPRAPHACPGGGWPPGAELSRGAPPATPQASRTGAAPGERHGCVLVQSVAYWWPSRSCCLSWLRRLPVQSAAYFRRLFITSASSLLRRLLAASRRTPLQSQRCGSGRGESARWRWGSGRPSRRRCSLHIRQHSLGDAISASSPSHLGWAGPRHHIPSRRRHLG